jgi:hypothetical protein
MFSRKEDNPEWFKFLPINPRSDDSFLLTGLASKSVLLGVRTSYRRVMDKLPFMSASGRLRTFAVATFHTSFYRFSPA